MNWINESLNRKFILGTTSGLVLSTLVFLLLYIPIYQSELEGARAETANQVNKLLQVSLENAMLKRDLPGLSDMVQKLGEQKDIVRVFITNPAGEIRFSSRDGDFGKKLENPYLESLQTTRFIQSESQQELLRSINPVHNKPACKECHGPAEQNPINGILYVDYDASSLRHKVSTTTLMLMSAGSLIVILNLAGGWWFINSHILRPVKQLKNASQALTDGNLQTRVEMQGADELSRLGSTFDLMAERLQEKLLELEEQRGFLQALVDAIPDGIRIIDEDFKVVLVNQAYCEQHRLEDKLEVGATCYGVTHNANKPCPPTLINCPIHEVSRCKKPIKVVHQHHRLDLTTFEVEIIAAPMTIQQGGKEKTLIVESIRDLEKAVKYSQEQKLSELGRLATGVAHEIHNPLASLKLAMDATKNEIVVSNNFTDGIKQNFELIDDQINNCIEITGKLLKLGALPQEYMELVDVAAAINDTLALIRWQADEANISIEENYKNEGLRVLASDSEIRMVALNLSQNAFHAMPGGGILTVTCSIVEDKVQMVFSDTGAGIRPKDLPYIFDPFFSRRADDVKGTGLGLSISLAIIEKYGGTIKVTSEVSVGSVFTVILPNAEHELEGDR
ncbi:MAG: ATP-binding protein [Candidatus Thiodiazotropha taylori]|nr:ATP-binding protein [Candidatus Thiodiazotropha taylori]MCW4293160.1 ATP-binding protein [Candidatus Thiodiazotropha taylori]